MNALRDAIAWLAAPMFGSYLGMVALGGLDALVLRICPSVEATILPIVRIGPVEDIYRDATKVCFALHITQLRDGAPVKYAFFATAPLSDRIPVAAFLADADHDRLPSMQLSEHGVGTTWARVYCFDVPQTLTGQSLVVSGIALHRRHAFYDTPTTIPSFAVPARS